MREVAIRCLARFDPAAAFQAARRELRRAGGPERERYPHLLVALDRDQALPLLLDLAVEEAAVAHCWALGRALAAAGGCDLIRPWFSSAESTRRRAACRLAGRLPPDPWILDALRQRLDDGDRQVARAAARAFRLQEAAVTAQELAAALRAEADCAHRWAILDALIVVADPGDVGQPAPEWARAVAGGLTPAMAARLSRELERRRQAVLEEGRRQDDGE
jgi:hypothetical protein